MATGYPKSLAGLTEAPQVLDPGRWSPTSIALEDGHRAGRSPTDKRVLSCPARAVFSFQPKHKPAKE
jgi:hypothetical protein